MNSKFAVKVDSARFPFAILLSFFVAACSGPTRQASDYGIWSIAVISDGCGVEDALSDYWRTGVPAELAGLGLVTFQGGLEGFITNQYQRVDQHVVSYISDQRAGAIPTDCRSEIDLESSIGGAREGITRTYVFTRDRLNNFCRVRDFSFRVGQQNDRQWVTGDVRSCVDMVSGDDSFEFIQD